MLLVNILMTPIAVVAPKASILKLFQFWEGDTILVHYLLDVLIKINTVRIGGRDLTVRVFETASCTFLRLLLLNDLDLVLGPGLEHLACGLLVVVPALETWLEVVNVIVVAFGAAVVIQVGAYAPVVALVEVVEEPISVRINP